MLNVNSYALISAFFQKTNGVTPDLPLVYFEGSRVTNRLAEVPATMLGSMLTPRCTAIATPGTWFGSGTTPATVHDYTLTSPYVGSEFTFSTAAALSVVNTADGVQISTTYNVTNKTTSEKTISEIGVFAGHNGMDSDAFLLDHTVLETPITVPAGGTVPIFYAVVFKYPAA